MADGPAPENSPSSSSSSPSPPRVRESDSPFWLLVSAVMFLYVGFGLQLRGTSPSDLYNLSVTIFDFMAKGVGIGLLVVFLGSVAGFRPALGLSALLAAIAAVVCAAVGAVWVTHGDSQGWLLFIFAMVNGSAAGSAWRLWRGGAA